MILPEILIYKHRSSLEEFCVDEEGCYNKYLFEALLKCKDVVTNFLGDLEAQYLSLFNTAHYLCADIGRSKFPYLKTREYYDYIRSNVKGGSKKEDAVIAMVLAMLNPYVSESRVRLVDAFRKWADRNFLNNFFIMLPSMSDFSIIGGPWLALPMLTEEYLECNKKRMLWKGWTDNFSEKGIRTLVMDAGVSKEERLNLLDAIAIEAKNNGFEEVFGILQELYEQVGMEKDSIDGYRYRTREQFEVLRELKTDSNKNFLKTENDELKKENELNEKRIKEYENKISVLENNLTGVREEYIQLIDEITSLRADNLCKDARILELETENMSLKLKLDERKNTGMGNEQIHITINNVGTETKRIEQAIGVVESGAQVIHTNKSE